MHYLLTVQRIWHKGSSTAGQEELNNAVSGTLACLKTLSTIVGQSSNFPKAHDLNHIAQDIRMFGSSVNYSTGMAVRYDR